MKKMVLLVGALALATACFADKTDAVRKQLVANYKLVSKGFENNNLDKVANLMTDDYVEVMNGRSANKKEIIAQVKRLAGQMHNSKWTRSIRTLTLSGNTAVAIVDGKFSAQMSDPHGGSHVFDQNAVTKDTWIKTPKGYRLKRSDVTSMKMTMDGKPFTMNGGTDR